MSEYKIREAVAKYDVELAQFGDWEFGDTLNCEDGNVSWSISQHSIRMEHGSLTIECDVLDYITHADLMRAMVAADNALDEALK